MIGLLLTPIRWLIKLLLFVAVMAALLMLLAPAVLDLKALAAGAMAALNASGLGIRISGVPEVVQGFPPRLVVRDLRLANAATPDRPSLEAKETVVELDPVQSLTQGRVQLDARIMDPKIYAERPLDMSGLSSGLSTSTLATTVTIVGGVVVAGKAMLKLGSGTAVAVAPTPVPPVPGPGPGPGPSPGPGTPPVLVPPVIPPPVVSPPVVTPPGPVGPGPVTPGPVTPGPVTPGPVTPGPVTPGPVTPGPVTPGPVTPGPVTPGPVTPGPVTPGPVSPGPVTPGPVTPGPVTPGPVTPGPVTPGPVTPTGPQVPVPGVPGMCYIQVPCGG
ncbi:MAG TPA: hypothetical protein VEB20_18615 [Azospirillaceae bacterium]|nr:hypothetical protein [Azospirillaceae bacterium]